MNEQLQKEIALWLTQIRGSVETAGSFVVEQAPLVIQDALRYGRIVHVVAAIGFAVLIAIFCYLAKRWWKLMWDYTVHDDLPAILIPLGLLAAGVGTLIGGFIPQARLALLAWFAPRLYIIEWLAGLVK